VEAENVNIWGEISRLEGGLRIKEQETKTLEAQTRELKKAIRREERRTKEAEKETHIAQHAYTRTKDSL
jgi:hypothetical protein